MNKDSPIVCSPGVTGDHIVSLNNGTAAMLVFPTNPLGIEQTFSV